MKFLSIAQHYLKQKIVLAYELNILELNIGAAVVFGIAVGLAQLHVPYLQYLVGIPVLFIPGLNITLCLEQMTERPQGIARVIFWTIIITFTISPAVLYFIASRFGTIGNEPTALAAFAVWWIITFTVWAVFTRTYHAPATRLVFPRFQTYRTFWLALTSVVVILGVHLVLYAFIPEADGYGYLIKIRYLLNAHYVPSTETRPFFLILVWFMNSLSHIDPYWLFKAIIPLMGSLIFTGLFYTAARRLTDNRFILIVSAIAFLSFPVIASEMLITRPQTIFMIVLPLAIFLLQELMKDKTPQNLLWFLVLLIATVFGYRFHELFLFLVGIVVVAGLVFLRATIRRYLLESIILLLSVGALIYPILTQSRIMAQVAEVEQPIRAFLSAPTFRWWFISQYVNIDGIQVGWPGFTWLYYYGYNLGLLLPILIVIMFIFGSVTGHKIRTVWIYLLCLLTFTVIAEVLPRLNIAFLPDRAWLFIMLMVTMLIPYLLRRLWSCQIPPQSHRLIRLAITIAIVASLGVSWSVTYLKQGRVSRHEYQAAEYLRTQTPTSAVIVTQDGNNALVSYFGERSTDIPPAGFFNTSNASDAIDYLTQQTSNQNKHAEAVQDSQTATNRITELLSQFTAASAAVDQRLILEQIRVQQTIRDNNAAVIHDIDFPAPLPPLYILYSYDKFNSFSGNRDWWRQANFFEADLDKFNHDSHFTKVYDRDAIIIWKFNPPKN